MSLAGKLESIVRGIIIVGTIGTSLVATYSLFSPRFGGATVASQEELLHGKPTPVLSKTEKSVSIYAEMSIYPVSLTEFKDDSKRAIMQPTEVGRFEYDEKTKTSVYVTRQGTSMSNPVVKAGEEYRVQIDLPPTFKEVTLSYAGVRLDLGRPFAVTGSGNVVVIGVFTPKTGSYSLVARVKYPNGEEETIEAVVNGS